MVQQKRVIPKRYYPPYFENRVVVEAIIYLPNQAGRRMMGV
jgi:hypothetical protein